MQFSILVPNIMFLYQNRPASIQQQIDDAYQNLAVRPISNWTVNGDTYDYYPCNVHEYPIILELIKERLQKGQREFYFLDVGAGLFGWGRQIAVRLTREFKENEAFKQYGQYHIHIIGITGEGHGEELSEDIIATQRSQPTTNTLKSRSEIIKNILVEDMSLKTGITRVLTGDYCTVYEFGNFKAENIVEILATRLSACQNQIGINQSILGMFDYVISNSFLQHIVDPAGTLEQMLNLLSVNGIAQLSGSRIDLEYEGKNIDNKIALIHLLNAINLKFFTGTPLYHEPTFMIQRTSPEAILFPISYNESCTKSYRLTLNAPIDLSFDLAETLSGGGNGNIPNAAGLRLYLAVQKLLPPREVPARRLGMFERNKKYITDEWIERFGQNVLTEPCFLVFDIWNKAADLDYSLII